MNAGQTCHNLKTNWNKRRADIVRWYINSEVLLINLLEYRDDVTYQNIEDYCGQIEALLKSKQSAESVLFDLNPASFSEDLSRYPKIFRFASGAFHKGLAFQTRKQRFRQNLDEERQNILSVAAKNVLCVPSGSNDL